MGSPPDEQDRLNDETQHWVTLTEGFWLADTACTQALWLAVMGGRNPSRFTDDLNNPVEQVSYDNVQTFLRKLQTHLPEGIEAVLPTEAQWEYACRAGSPIYSPFSFGDNITPEQVNYDGNYPYQNAVKGLYRQSTVPVKSLPANAWGLYEMHGNVWEWCADAPLPATADAVTNPDGKTGKDVKNFSVRGGSWSNLAQLARSAQRNVTRRDWRVIYLGFRFALRSTSPAGAASKLEGRDAPAQRAPQT